MSVHEVSITEPNGARMLTPFVSNLQFVPSVDPGGFGSITFDLARAVDARNFAEYSEIAVWDAETGEQACSGRLQNPGRGIAGDGEVWKITALGEGIAHTQERKNPYFVVDSRLDPWYQGDGTSINRQWSTGAAPNDNSKTGYIFTINQTTVGADAFTNANFYDVRRYGQEIGGFVYVHEEGRASSNSHLQGQLRVVGGSAPTDIVDQTWSTTKRTVAAEKGTDWSGTAFDLMNFVYVRDTDSPTINTEVDWCLVYSAVILALRKARDGTDVVGGGAYSKGYVLAHEAVIDALARWCPRIDLANAEIATSATHEHTSLVWPDGINTYDELNYLMSVEPQFTWAVWEKQANKLFRFEWRERETRVRYEIAEVNIVDFDLPGGQYDPLARVWYTGTNLLGHYATARIDADNPYAAQNILPTDTRPITLNNVSGHQWADDAIALGGSAVTDSQFAATAAKATIVGKVLDLYTGRYVKPEKVLAGYLCRLAGVRVQQDTLNTGYEPGASVFRTVSNDHTSDAAASTLELNSYNFDEERGIANLYGTAGALR